jgi:hypothetical protein
MSNLTKFINVLIFVVICLNFSLTSRLRTKTPLSEAEGIELMKKYLPVFYFHPSEKSFPTSIESFKIDWTKVAFDDDSQVYDIKEYKGETSLKQNAPIYVSILENSDGSIRISYLCLYGWNDAGSSIKFTGKATNYNQSTSVLAGKYGIDLHYSDVEHIEVILKKDKSLNYLTYAYHQWTKDYQVKDLSWDGTHPIVYIALGAHASYPKSGEITYFTSWSKSKKTLGVTLYDTSLTLVDSCAASSIQGKKWFSTNPRLLKLNGNKVSGISTDEENLSFKYSGRLGVEYENVKWDSLKSDIKYDAFMTILKLLDKSTYNQIDAKMDEVEKMMEAKGSKSFYKRSFW